jgi:hypothetical protein
MFGTSCRPAKTTQSYLPWSFVFPSPRKKFTTQPTQNDSPSRLPHHRYTDPGADSLIRPHLRINCVDLPEDSCPGRISDHVFAPSRTRISSPLFIVREQRPRIPHIKHNPTRVRPMVQDYPLTRPSPGVNRPSTPPSLHWCEETYPKEESRKTIYFFLFP